jgi:hypothetical protein
MDKTSKVLKGFTKAKIASAGGSPLELPNHSGRHDAGTVEKVPVNDFDIVNKKYLDNLPDYFYKPGRVSGQTGYGGTQVGDPLYLYASAGGTNEAAGGAIALISQDGNGTLNGLGHDGGNFVVYTGEGSDGTVDKGGIGGQAVFYLKNGGIGGGEIVPGAQGGLGGRFVCSCGTGGDGGAAGGRGGYGGEFDVRAGEGGRATADGTGGKGGAILLTAGNGGTSPNGTGGTGGNIDLVTGTGGVAGGTNGTDGDLTINGLAGWSGTFTSGIGQTVTVTKGIITSVV